MKNVWPIFVSFQGILNTGGQGGPPKFVLPQILFFLWLKTQHKISEPYINSFWEKSNGPGKKEREKTPLIVDT